MPWSRILADFPLPTYYFASLEIDFFGTVMGIGNVNSATRPSALAKKLKSSRLIDSVDFSLHIELFDTVSARSRVLVSENLHLYRCCS